jgi:hypothetical protein
MACVVLDWPDATGPSPVSTKTVVTEATSAHAPTSDTRRVAEGGRRLPPRFLRLTSVIKSDDPPFEV